jgi:hypothetical protein
MGFHPCSRGSNAAVCGCGQSPRCWGRQGAKRRVSPAPLGVGAVIKARLNAPHKTDIRVALAKNGRKPLLDVGLELFVRHHSW